jgi:hypothetical protein
MLSKVITPVYSLMGRQVRGRVILSSVTDRIRVLFQELAKKFSEESMKESIILKTMSNILSL